LIQITDLEYSILLIYFVNSLDQQTTTSLAPYVTSHFTRHSLVSAIGFISHILGAILQLPTAKILDIWGRSEGFAGMMSFCTVGQILMAVCQNVETFAAAQVSPSILGTGNFVLTIFRFSTLLALQE
jgi:MFS family permease